MEEKIKVNATIPLDSAFNHILFNLGAQGYAAIRIDYSGGGDEGYIERIVLIKAGEIEFVGEEGVVDSSTTEDNLIELGQELHDLVESKVDEQILQSASDWWNNEGGGGTLYISTYDCQYYGNHYINVVQKEHESLTGYIKD